MRGRWCVWLWLLTAAAAGFALAPAARAAAGEGPVQAELLADASAVAAGQPFKVGVLFRIAPEWHIYWKYPGDAGLATAVRLELPKGFVAGELQWPLPQSFVQPGDIAGYGYTGSVMLTAEVTPPRELPAGKEFAIRAKVSWLSCRDICRPGRAELNAKLAVAAQRAPANEALFREWAARLPRTEKELLAAGRLRSVAATAETLPPGRRHENRDRDHVGDEAGEGRVLPGADGGRAHGQAVREYVREPDRDRDDGAPLRRRRGGPSRVPCGIHSAGRRARRISGQAPNARRERRRSAPAIEKEDDS